MPSNGSFWYGNSIGFPGFLYKKNNGVGARQSTKMTPGGNTTCNGPTYIYNKYKPGGGGVGASSMANRRAKNRLATICGGPSNKCFPCYNTLGQYSNYTHNPNGYVPCPSITTTNNNTPVGTNYSVTYYGNTNTSGVAPTDGSSPYNAGSSVTILGNTGSLAKTGYIFVGWNTAANGSGTAYSPTNTFTINANTALYAQWVPDGTTYSVTYNGNTNTGGTAPTDGSSPYNAGSSVTILGNTGSLTKTGYTFAGWNTAANGSGTSYSPTNTFTINANTTLYAQWTPITYSVTYNGNTNTGGTAPTDGSSPYNAGSSVTILGNTGSLTKTGYTFAGWNTAANGSGTSYSPTNTFTINANTTLYAQWTPITYSVTYNGNTNTGGTAPTDGSSPYNAGSSVTILGNTGSLTKTGYTFAGWNTAANGSGTSYSPTNTFTINANTTLYAQWTPVGTTYSVTYNGNTNTSGIAPVDGSSPYNAGSSVTILGNSGSPVLAKTGYQFAGWNTDPSGNGTSYVGEDTFNINANTTLYAQWIIGGFRLRYFAGTGGTGTAPPSSGTFYTPYTSTDVVGNTGSFTNGALVFGGWNTAADGTGRYYTAGSNITMTATTDLYAQWINPATQYTLTYNAGTGGSGTPPVPTTSYASKTPVDISGNTFTNIDPSYVFYGWYTTDMSGNVTSYYPVGSVITMTANTTLYAQWVSDTTPYTVTYYGNGNAGGAVPAPAISYPGGVQVPILGIGTLTNPGYTFLGWNSDPSGNGSVYAPGYTFASKTANLYALWAPGSSVKNCGGSTASSGTGPTSIQYIFPYAQIIQSTNTITIYTTALLGTTTSNYGSGAAPLGIISIASKTIITQDTIQINVNTSYSNSANDYNYAKTITNVTDFTYWPVAATISSVSFPTIAMSNVLGNTPNYFVGTQNVTNGCGLTSSSVTSDTNSTTYNYFNQGLTLNFSNLSNTIFVASPNNSFTTTNTGSTWTQTSSSVYPYAGIVPKSDYSLTTISITTSAGSQYIYPPLPNYTLTYDGNGNTSGYLPSFGVYMSPYTATTTYTILGNTSAIPLAKTGFTFSGWNTAANGSGTAYVAGNTYNGGASLRLYARWV